jgi:hypothetical protein
MDGLRKRDANTQRDYRVTGQGDYAMVNKPMAQYHDLSPHA